MNHLTLSDTTLTDMALADGAATIGGRHARARQRVNLSWLVKWRWAAIAGQLATILIVRHILKIELPLSPLLAILCLAGASNLALGGWLRRRGLVAAASARGDELLLGSLLLLDNLLLTALLYYTGGPANPFTVYYLVSIALAAALLGAGWAWLLNAAAFCCFALLFFVRVPLAELEHGHEHEHAMHHHTVTAAGPMSLHLQGSLIAFGGAGSFIVYFITRVTRELARREAELDAANERRARADKLEALATLAAGAAHELATPLSTIAVLSHDLDLALANNSLDEAEVSKDVQLIRSEAARCRRILDAMAAGAGETVGEPWATVPAEEILRSAISELAEAERVDLFVQPDLAGSYYTVPRLALTQALRAIVHNALQAAPAPSRIQLSGKRVGNDWLLTVTDHGCGMSPEVMRRVGEPFFTTRQPGSGMGLGLYLARRVIERLGGSLTLESTPGVRTTAMLRIPLTSQRAAGSPAAVNAASGHPS